MQIVESGPLTDAQRAALEGSEPHPFGTAGDDLAWRPKDRHVLLHDDDGRLVASVGLVSADVRVGDREPFATVGLGGVIVASPYRGRGFARTVLEAALEQARTMGPSVALLFCRDAVMGLYDRLGFEAVQRPVRVLQPTGGPAVMPQNTMWRPLRDGAVWPAGPVLVLSRPF